MTDSCLLVFSLGPVCKTQCAYADHCQPGCCLCVCCIVLQEEQALGDNARVVGAFVTFMNEHSKLNTLKATPQSWIRQWWHLKPQHKFRGRWAPLTHPPLVGPCRMHSTTAL